MIIGLPLTADQIASIGTGINFIRLKMGGRMFYPTNMSADNSSIQSWTIQIKNNSQGGFSEGAFAGDPAEIAWSSDNQNWLTIMKGQVDGSGAKRVEGNQTDDYLTFSIKDYAEAWGTSKDIDDTVLCGYRICDPSNPGSSIVHWLAGKMGLTADQVDCGTISQVLDLVQISGTPWSNLQKLGEAYGVSVRFTGDGKLWFHSVCETGFTEPSNEWTIDADLNNLASDSHSNAIGKISSSFLKRTCTKAESSFTIYKLLSRQQIYKCTENANSSTGYCHVEVKANSTYPEEGVMELKYKDPSTGEEFAHAIEVEIPTVGITESCEIFATGELTLDYFSADDVQGSARIRLKNSTSSAIYIKKLVLYGKPYSKQDDTKVTYELSTVPEEEKADASVDGTFGTTSALMTAVLKRKCSIEGIRRREFSLSTWFLPQVQLGMGLQIRKAGEIISCTVASYRHSLTGKTLATLRTDLTLEEISEFVPDEDPDIIIHNPNYSLSTKGDKGDSGETPVTLYAVGSSRTVAPELSASWGSSEGEWGSSEGSWGIRVEWASEAPAVPAGFYLWSKSKLPSEIAWSYVCLTGAQGDPGTDAKVFDFHLSSQTFIKNDRRNGNQTISFTPVVQGYIPAPDVSYSVLADGSITIPVSLIGGDVFFEVHYSNSFTIITITMSAGLDTVSKKITVIDKTEYSVYLGELSALPTITSKDEPLIYGDYFLAAAAFESDGVTYSAGVPYSLTRSATWAALNPSDVEYSEKMLQCLGGVLKSGVAVPSASALYAWFENLAAQNAVIQNLFSKAITINEGGVIASGVYQPGVKGFRLTYDGLLSAISATLVNCFLTGKLTIEASGGEGGMLLKTQYGQIGSSASISETAWNTRDLDIHHYSDQTIAFGGISYDVFAKVTSGYYDSSFGIYSNGYDFCGLQPGIAASQILTIKISGEYLCGANGIDVFRIYKNNALIFASALEGNVTAVSCIVGDVIRMEMASGSYSKSCGYFFATNFSKGLFFTSSDFTSQAYVSEQYIPSTTSLIITSAVESHRWSSDDHVYYSLPDMWISLFSDGSNANINESVLSVEGVSKTAKYGVRTGNSVTLNFSDDSSLTVTSGMYCHASGTIVLLTESRGLKTDRLLPMSDVTDIGTPADKFKTLYIGTVNGTKLIGDVNELGDGHIVYGAVFN